MPLAPLDLLPSVVAPLTPLVGHLDALAVHDAGTGLRILPRSLAPRPPQEVMDTLPGAAPPPLPEVPIHRLPGRQVMGQQPPGTTRPKHLADRVAALPPVMAPRPPPPAFGLAPAPS